MTSRIAGKTCPDCGAHVPLYLVDPAGRPGIRGPGRESVCDGCGVVLRMTRNGAAEIWFALIMIFGMAGIATGVIFHIVFSGQRQIELVVLLMAGAMILFAFLGMGLMSRVTRRVEKVARR